MNTLPVYQYLDANKLLFDLWHNFKANKPQLSVRILASKVGIKSHTALHSMINGKRKISRNVVGELASFFSLSVDEAQYFDLLVRLSQAKTEKEKSNIEKLIQISLRKDNTKTLTIDNSEIQRNPISFFILELIDIEKTPNSAVHIHKKLIAKCSIAEVDNILNCLIRADFIHVTDGYLTRNIAKYIYSKHDAVNPALKIYQSELCRLAQAAIINQPILEKEFNGVCLAVDKKRMKEMKAYLRGCMQDFITRFEATGTEEKAIYQFNTQFFKVIE